jgi:hypothetical protein
MSSAEIGKRFIMKKTLFISGLILFAISAHTQETDYFKTKRDYIYSALYIDSIGDTITNETLTIRVLDRPWIAQPWLQRSIRYIYDTDTTAYKNYIDPSDYFRERNARKYEKNGEFPLAKKSTTGGFESQRYSYFYMHPPRSNQYRMLFHAAHPTFFYSALENETDTAIVTNHDLYGAGHMYQKYIYHNLGEKIILRDSLNVYQVNVSSHLVTEKDYYSEKLDFYDSTLDALFSFEYGFLKMHYEFKSGVRIEFDLIEVVPG